MCGGPPLGPARQIAGEHATSNTIVLPFQPEATTPAHLAPVSYLARCTDAKPSTHPTQGRPRSYEPIQAPSANEDAANASHVSAEVLCIESSDARSSVDIGRNADL